MFWIRILDVIFNKIMKDKFRGVVYEDLAKFNITDMPKYLRYVWDELGSRRQKERFMEQFRNMGYCARVEDWTVAEVACKEKNVRAGDILYAHRQRQHEVKQQRDAATKNSSILCTYCEAGDKKVRAETACETCGFAMCPTHEEYHSKMCRLTPKPHEVVPIAQATAIFPGTHVRILPSD